MQPNSSSVKKTGISDENSLTISRVAKSKIKVAIADDHQIFIEGIKSLLRENQHIQIVGEVSDGKELLDLLKSKKVDVVLMDVSMPNLDGLEATRKIYHAYPDVKIIGLTMFEDTTKISDMMRAGASGYLFKTTGKHELVNAIQKVYTGQKYLSPEVSNKLIDRMIGDEFPKETPVRHAEITPREKDIIKLIAQEMTNNEIAQRLNNSPMTIITHRKNLLRKLGLKNTAGLIKYAVEHGLLE